jgi:hypothetical protein
MSKFKPRFKPKKDTRGGLGSNLYLDISTRKMGVNPSFE